MRRLVIIAVMAAPMLIGCSGGGGDPQACRDALSKAFDELVTQGPDRVNPEAVGERAARQCEGLPQAQAEEIAASVIEEKMPEMMRKAVESAFENPNS